LPEHGRHAAPRGPARRRAVLLPAVLLLASGTALIGLAVVPAAASDRPAAAKAESARAAEPPMHADVALVRALGKGAAQPERETVARATRDRRPAPATATPAPAPKPPPPSFVRPGTGRVTSPFGHRWGQVHAGLDLAAGIGAPVRAATAGTVVSAATEGGYGKVVRLQHAERTVTVYAHLSEISVTVGQQVPAGHVVGLEGNTGHSTGPHLHFEVRVDDVPVDPAAWLQARGVVL
jgi:murein DD-endopeptidase MepM/ murein hydrolase activator NlpD